MQTFLPSPGFAASAATLDPRRLGKQRVEALQILRALTQDGSAWRNHPAVLMWKGYEEALVAYGVAVCRAWCELGFDDTVEAKLRADLAATGIGTVRDQAELAAAGALPPWLGDPALHRSHQSLLVRKDPAHYEPQFPGVPDDLEYVWPVRSAAVLEAERRRAANAAARAARAEAKAELERAKAARRRSRAARRGWATRRSAGGNPGP
jgi:hypothetical protein